MKIGGNHLPPVTSKAALATDVPSSRAALDAIGRAHDVRRRGVVQTP
jgi:hypothetical protein